MSYPITGIPMPTHPDPQHPIPLRKEVTAWASDPENAVQLSLFIQALTKFQQMDPLDPKTGKLSYYQIAGIHGQPAMTWDGTDTHTGPWYCNHQRTTFPTWHRPYLLLFEQRIYEIMMSEIVSNVSPATEQSIWAIEASHWRLPYWDWSVNQPYLQKAGVPQLFTLPTIKVVMPNSGSQVFNNPLWAFNNPKIASTGKPLPMGDNSMGNLRITAGPFNSAAATSRHCKQPPTPPGDDWIYGTNFWQGVNASIQNQDNVSWPLADLVSRLLTDGYLKSWRYFSSTAHWTEISQKVSPTNFLSLENIHNTIHGLTGASNGTTGHMAVIAVAAFDPIFFLHHCNVDRLCAEWQTLNPSDTSWFDHLSAGESGPTAQLPPFHIDTNFTVYNSNNVRDWTTLHYQYDTTENTPRYIRARVARSQGQVTGDDIRGYIRRNVNLHLNRSRHAVLASPHLRGKENDYIINIVYDRYGLDGRPYSIYFFVGSVPDNVPEGTLFEDIPGYVGTVYTFSSQLELEGQGNCQNCVEQRKAGVLSRAQLILTEKLINRANDTTNQEINSLEPNEVEDYLTKHLSWKIVETENGRNVPIQELQRTKVYVMAGKTQHFEDPQQPSQYGDYGHMFGPTQHKTGGAVPEDEGTHMEL